MSAIRLLKLKRGIRGSGPLLSPLSLLLLTSLFHMNDCSYLDAVRVLGVSRESARPCPGAISQRAAQDRQHAFSIRQKWDPAPVGSRNLPPGQQFFH